MRREKLEVLLLSDVHTADSGRLNTSYTTVALEEIDSFGASCADGMA